jgi:hypothetical protein
MRKKIMLVISTAIFSFAAPSYAMTLSITPATQDFSVGDPGLGDQLDLSGGGLNNPQASPSVGNVNLLEVSLFDTAGGQLSAETLSSPTPTRATHLRSTAERTTDPVQVL